MPGERTLCDDVAMTERGWYPEDSVDSLEDQSRTPYNSSLSDKQVQYWLEVGGLNPGCS